MFEIEKKAYIDDFLSFLHLLKEQKDFEYLGVSEKKDYYFADRLPKEPNDFKNLKTLFRVRVKEGISYLTLKKKSFSGNTEVNTEVEVSLSSSSEKDLLEFWIKGLELPQEQFLLEKILRPNNLEDWKHFWATYGFVFLFHKIKKTELFSFHKEQIPVSIELNHILDLGHFLEIEVLVKEKENIPQAVEVIDELFQRFGIPTSKEEPRLYIELLYQKQHSLKASL